MSTEHSAEERLQALIDVSRSLMSAADPEELLRAILDSVIQLFDAGGCSIGLIDTESRELVFSQIAGRAHLEEFRLPLGKGIAGHVASSGEPVVANDVRRDPRFFAGIDETSGFTTRSILCVPLRTRDHVIGALEALNTANPAGFTEGDLDLLSAFGGLAATAIERLRAEVQVRSSNAALRAADEDRYELVGGRSAAMREVIDTARTAAASKSTVMLLGESGVGKEVVARSIHRWSPRAEGPFVAVNCVALSPQLLESELFGHEKGSFTGATAQRKGKFEIASGGTIFLDEIGDLAPELQTKLLRVLQEREIQRVGGNRDLRVDVRVVAATNRDLSRAMSEGRFREDLYYRLNVVAIYIPPLRERRDDIPDLVDSFLATFSRETGRPNLGIEPSALEALVSRPWPGNVRQLRNAIERAVVLSDRDRLGLRDFEATDGTGTLRPAEGAGPDEALPLSEAVDAFRIARIRRALEEAGGNQTKAAERLGLRQSNLSRLMRSLGMRD